MTTDQAEHGPTVVHRALASFVDRVCQHPRLTLVLTLGLAALAVFLAATRLEYRTHRNDLMAPDKECQKRWRMYLDEFGNDDEMVVVVTGADRQRLIDTLEAVAAEINQRPDLFDRLFYKVDLRHLHRRALLYLSCEQVRGIADGLDPMKPLLGLGPGAWRYFTLASLVQVAQLKAGVARAGQPLTPGDEQFYRQMLAICRSADATLADPDAYTSPWSSLAPAADGQEKMLAEPQYFFSGDGSLAFLSVRPARLEHSFTAARTSIDALRTLLDGIRARFPDVQVGLTGLPVLENDEMVASQNDSERASWIALAAVGLLYVVVFRGLRYPLITVGTLVVGIAWAMGWLTLTVGSLNILSATFAVMLIAMGDYGVLWVTRYEQARQGGRDPRAALVHTATHVAVGNLTAATALALAFFAALLADFQAVAQLGWIAGCGVLLCALACFTVLPAALMLTDRRGDVAPAAIPIGTATGWLPRLSARPGLVLGCGLAVILVLAIFAARVPYDANLLHLQSPGLESVRWEHTLLDKTKGASWHALSYTNTPEEALALKARYEQLPEVSLVVEAASLVPREQEPKLALLQAIQSKLDTLPPRGSSSLRDRPDPVQLKGTLTAAANRLATLAAPSSPGAAASFGPVASAPGLSKTQALLAEVRPAMLALARRLADTPPDVAADRLLLFEQRLTGDLAENLHKLKDVSHPEPITLADLPPALKERFVGKNGKWLLRVFARDALWDLAPMKHFNEQVRSVDSDATGKTFSTAEGLDALKSGFLWAGLYALIVIVGVLLLDFRGVRPMLVAVAPLAVGMLLALGVLGLCGLNLNPANMIALPLILGVGVDNGVHVLHDHILRRAAGFPTISRAIGRGVLVKALSTMIAFGALMISSHRGLFSLGFILTLGVGCCMLTALVLLPCVLRLGFRPQPQSRSRDLSRAA